MKSILMKNKLFIVLATCLALPGAVVFAKHSDSEFRKFRNHFLILEDGHPARSCASGEPLTFWFVNNTSTPPGDGTFAHPFPTLIQAQNAAQPGDIIYVFPGDKSDKGQNAGIILTQGQQLLGATICQEVKTKEGLVKIPAQATGPLPTISDELVDQVTLFAAVQLSQGDNVVSGLNLVDEIAYFVFSPVLNSSGALNIYGGTNYVIKNNTLNEVPFNGGLGNALNVFGGGDVKICKNTFIAQSGSIDTYGILILNGFGISTPFQGNFLIKKNEFRGLTDQDGFSQGIHTDTFIADGKLCVSIVDNLFDSVTNTIPVDIDPLYGIDINSGVEFAKYTITGNTISLPNGATPTCSGTISSYNFAAGVIISAYSPTTYAEVHGNTVINKYIPANLYISPSYVFFDNGNPANLQFVADDKIECHKHAEVKSFASSADITKKLESKFKGRVKKAKK